MKNWLPIAAVAVVGLLALKFLPRILDIWQENTRPTTADDLVSAINAANKAAADKLAADAKAAGKKNP